MFNFEFEVEGNSVIEIFFCSDAYKNHSLMLWLSLKMIKSNVVKFSYNLIFFGNKKGKGSLFSSSIMG